MPVTDARAEEGVEDKVGVAVSAFVATNKLRSVLISHLFVTSMHQDTK
jgi:hypothetical protein